MKTSRLITQSVLILLLLILLTPLSQSQVTTNVDELHRLAEKYQAQWDSQRGDEFLRLKTIKTGAWGAINSDPRIDLIGVNESGRPLFLILNNLDAAIAISTDDVWPGGTAGYGLSGSGTTLGQLGLWDGGLPRDTHVEFDGRITWMDVIPGNQFNQSHATALSGTLIAAGLNPDAKGMSYEAELVAYNSDNDHAEIALAAADGMLVSTHCYGAIRGWFFGPGFEWMWYGDIDVSETEDYLFGFYTQVSAAWDEIAYNAPYYTMVKSGGNDRLQGPPPGTAHQVRDTNNNWVWSTDVRDLDGGPAGYDCIGERGCAKNNITVCSVDDIPGGYQDVNDVTQNNTAYSTCGPTDDGRIKPDIVVSGESLLSTAAYDQAWNPSNNSYTEMGGTSATTPVVAGSINLIVEHYSNLYNDNPPLSSTIKSILAHTADEAGPDPGPDYVFGWGLMNTRRAVDLVQYSTDVVNTITETILNDQDVDVYQFYADGNSPIRATLAWTDPPGTPIAPALDDRTPMLVNDLDLRLTRDADLVAFYPWTLDPDNPSDPATPSDQVNDNVVDNIEQIVLSNPDAGFYTIEVSHKNTLENNLQQYSLVITHAPYPDLTPVYIEHEIALNLNGVNSVFARDINRDGLKDVVSAALQDNEVTYWQATNNPDSWNEITVNDNFDGALCVAVADIDGDRDDDIIGSALETGGLVWWENTNFGNTWTIHQVDATTLGVRNFEIADMDNDGDVDIVGAESLDEEITWWENTNNGMTWIEHIVDIDYTLPEVIHVADLNMDGYKDIIAVGEFSQFLNWWENPGDVLPWTEHVIDNDTYGISISSGDFDNDGDIDVVSSSLINEEVSCWENLGDGLSWFGHFVEINYSGYQVEVVDLDIDGSLDILSSSESDDLVTWFRNGGNGFTWNRFDLVTGFNGVRGIDAADMDNDSDIDIVAAGHYADQVNWWEQDGTPDQPGLIAITLTELNPPVYLPTDGGFFIFDFLLKNNIPINIQGDIWSELVLPNGTTFGPLQVVNGINIPANAVLTFNNLSQEIPFFAPPGTYSYVINGGLYPNFPVASGSIEFTKVGGVPAAMQIEDWNSENFDEIFSDYLMSGDEYKGTVFPSEYRIAEIYPNPFNPATSVNISLPEKSLMQLTVTNTIGQQVEILADGSYSAGYHSFTFEGTNLSSGIYFIHAFVPGKMNEIRKVVLMK